MTGDQNMTKRNMAGPGWNWKMVGKCWVIGRLFCEIFPNSLLLRFSFGVAGCVHPSLDGCVPLSFCLQFCWLRWRRNLRTIVHPLWALQFVKLPSSRGIGVQPDICLPILGRGIWFSSFCHLNSPLCLLVLASGISGKMGFCSYVFVALGPNHLSLYCHLFAYYYFPLGVFVAHDNNVAFCVFCILFGVDPLCNSFILLFW